MQILQVVQGTGSVLSQENARYWSQQALLSFVCNSEGLERIKQTQDQRPGFHVLKEVRIWSLHRRARQRKTRSQFWQLLLGHLISWSLNLSSEIDLSSQPSKHFSLGILRQLNKRNFLLIILMPARIVLILSSSRRFSSTKVIKELAKFISCCF